MIGLTIFFIAGLFIFGTGDHPAPNQLLKPSQQSDTATSSAVPEEEMDAYSGAVNDTGESDILPQ